MYRYPSSINMATAGKKIIKGNIAPHLDFGLHDDIEIKVKRNVSFEAMVRMFDERDVIYLADFARFTKYPNKLHSMARERQWDAVIDNNRVVGYRNPYTLNNLKTGERNQDWQSPIKKQLFGNGYLHVTDLIAVGYTRNQIATVIYNLRKDGYVIESITESSTVGGVLVERYKLISH